MTSSHPSNSEPKYGNIAVSRVKNYINTNIKPEITEICKNDEQKALSIGLTAICLQEMTGRDVSFCKKYIIDGGKDNGIDGIYYNKSENKLNFIQSKWSNNGQKTISPSDISELILGIGYILNLDFTKFNERLNFISSEVSDWIRNDPYVNIIIVMNTDNKIHDDCLYRLNEYIKDNRVEDDESLVQYEIYGFNRILRSVKVLKSGGKTNTEISLLDWGEHTKPFYSIYGKICCADLVKIYSSYGENLFSENIRGSLTSDINSSIKDSLDRNPESFWYLNNGVTAIADKINKKPIGLGHRNKSGYWDIENLKIVNGAQTTNSVYLFSKQNNSEKKLEEAYVSIKIISLKDAPDDFSSKITIASNTQNKIESSDFISIDPKQEIIEEKFKSIGKRYIYKRGSRDEENSIQSQQLALTLALRSTNMADVVQAKRNFGSLTDPNSAYYKRLFSEDFDAREVLNDIENVSNLMKIEEELKKSISSPREKNYYSHANRFLEHICLMHNIRDKNVISNLMNLIKNNIDEEFGKECYLAVLFKNTKKCNVLRDKIIPQLKSLL